MRASRLRWFGRQPRNRNEGVPDENVLPFSSESATSAKLVDYPNAYPGQTLGQILQIGFLISY
jgi:hypothetical protein